MGRPKKYEDTMLVKIVEAYSMEYDCEIKISDLVKYACSTTGAEYNRKIFERCPAVVKKIKELNELYKKRNEDEERWAEEQYKTIDANEFIRKNDTTPKLIAAIRYLDAKDRLKTQTINDLILENTKLRSNTMTEEVKDELSEAKKIKDENTFLRKWIECNINGVSAIELLKHRSFPVKRDIEEGIPESEDTIIGYENPKKPYNLADDVMIESVLSLMDDTSEKVEDYHVNLDEIGESLLRELNGEI